MLKKEDTLLVKEEAVEFDRTERDYEAIGFYIEQCDDWFIDIDHEDGSTAPFTSLALYESMPEWER